MRIRRITLLILLACTAFSCAYDEDDFTPSDEIKNPFIDTNHLAFPGAEGYGAYAQGGRGGEVIYVTNLHDSGPGSLRDAISQEGPRTVLFAVSGVIELHALLIVNNPFLTIAGQSSPGCGITLKNSGLYIRTHDVIVRHIRIRPGDSYEGQPAQDRDAVTVGENSYSVILDHLSTSWSIDELITTWSGAHHVTVQHSILSEALSNSFHPDGEHSKALLVGDDCKQISVHHNIFAHNNDRCPQTKGGTTLDFVNNYVYNWGDFAFSFNMDYTLDATAVNLLGNAFFTGPSTTGGFFTESTIHYGSMIHLDENIGNDDLLIAYNQDPQGFLSTKDYLSDKPVNWTQNIQVENLSIIKDQLFTNVGASLPQRDEIDSRIIADIDAGTGSIIDNPDQVGGYPLCSPPQKSVQEVLSEDSDKDGIPDRWEESHGLNALRASDGREDVNQNGYTNLEEYLNSL